MKLITYKDEKGWKRCSLITDDMLPSQAYQGLPQSPPDVGELDCEALMRELNNAMVDCKLFTIADLNKNQGALRSIILSTFHRPIINLFKNHHMSGLEEGTQPVLKTGKVKEAVHVHSRH